MALTRKISKRNLGLALPQQGILSAPEKEIADKELEVLGIAPRIGEKDVELSGENTTADEINTLIVQLKAPSGRLYSLSLRQFLGLPVAPSNMEAGDIAKEFTKGVPSDKLKPLYNVYMDESEDEDIELPERITISHVEDRTTPDGLHVMYPPKNYEAFGTEITRRRTLHDADPNVNKKPFSVLDVYRDFNFMQSMYKSPPTNTEGLSPKKVVAITHSEIK